MLRNIFRYREKIIYWALYLLKIIRTLKMNLLLSLQRGDFGNGSDPRYKLDPAKGVCPFVHVNS